MKELYNMKLHEELKIDSEIYVLRVSGGWIYRFYEGGVKNTFVPYNNEFQ